MLAALPESELDRYFAETERLRFTPSTVISEKALRKEIAQVRADGYAFTDEEFSLGIAGIGRLATIAGEPIGAFSVAIPKARFDEAVKGRAIDLLERTTGLLESA
jgi:IclR family acetate operon transcriptional repressor